MCYHKITMSALRSTNIGRSCGQNIWLGFMKYRSDLKEVKEYTWVKDIVYNFCMALFFTLLLAVIFINVFDVRLDEVLSDSMYPEITKKDIVVVVKQDEYKVGDIIEYRKGDILVTHRIASLGEEPNTFIPKGDANNGVDGPVSLSQITGKVVAKWTNGRQVYNTIKNNYFIIIALIIGAWVLSTTFSGELDIRKHNILKI